MITGGKGDYIVFGASSTYHYTQAAFCLHSSHEYLKRSLKILAVIKAFVVKVSSTKSQGLPWGPGMVLE